MPTPAEFAKAYKCGRDAYETSWSDRDGKYTMEAEECFIMACERHKIPIEFWFVMWLVHSWPNDMNDWCQAVEEDRFEEIFLKEVKLDQEPEEKKD